MQWLFYRSSQTRLHCYNTHFEATSILMVNNHQLVRVIREITSLKICHAASVSLHLIQVLLFSRLMFQVYLDLMLTCLDTAVEIWGGLITKQLSCESTRRRYAKFLCSKDSWQETKIYSKARQLLRLRSVCTHVHSLLVLHAARSPRSCRSWHCWRYTLSIVFPCFFFFSTSLNSNLCSAHIWDQGKKTVSSVDFWTRFVYSWT